MTGKKPTTWHPEAVVTRREEQIAARVHQRAKEADRDLCNLLVKNKGFGVRQLWLKVLAWPQASCVTLSKSFTLAEPLLAHL